MSPTILPGRVASILGRLNGCGGSTGPGASPDVKIVDELVPCPTPRPRISAEVRRDVAGLRGGLRLGLETVAMVETGRVAVEAEAGGEGEGSPRLSVRWTRFRALGPRGGGRRRRSRRRWGGCRAYHRLGG